MRRTRDGFVVKLGTQETELVLRMLGELRELLVSDEPNARAITRRLFPVAYPGDDALEAEYQRLMRDELVQSRVTSIDVVEAMVGAGGSGLDEAQLTAFMQSLNAIRLVLGTMLDVSDDPEADEVRADMVGSAEHHLYGYLSWLLEHTVRALAGQAS